MRFRLTLITTNRFPELTLNYQYPLSAIIYQILHRAEASYIQFLKQQGSEYGSKSFKFFTFSDLRTPFSIRDDRLLMLTSQAELTVCFHIPESAENFIRELFLNHTIEIADSKSKVRFKIVAVISENLSVSVSGNTEILVQPMSPIVVPNKNPQGNYHYLSPDHSKYNEILIRNLVVKYAEANNASVIELAPLKSAITITPVYFRQVPRHRLIAIKEGTEAETKVRGYDKFRLRLQAPVQLLDLALNSGIGAYNSIGMGSLEVVQ